MDFDNTGAHTVYAFDVLASGNAINGKRPLSASKQWISRRVEGCAERVLAYCDGRRDILDHEGIILATIKTSYTAVSVNWSGRNFETLWIVGVGGVSEIALNLLGPILS